MFEEKKNHRSGWCLMSKPEGLDALTKNKEACQV